MGSQASIETIGKFNKEIQEFLDYPVDYYRGLTPKTMVMGYVCHVNTTDKSRILANAFHIELWDLSKHIFHIKNKKDFDVQLLQEALKGSECEYDDVYQRIRLFAKNKHTFIFRPNG